MIEIKKAEQSRCCNCCNSNQDVYNVTFWQNETNSGTQVALCKKCMDELGKLARLIEPEDNKNDGDSDDLISREVALKVFKDYTGLTTKSEEARHKIISILKSLPSAEPERKKGTWVVHDYALGRERYECTECRGRCDLEYNFCPHCGAEME